ncbi:PQQ-binding-like beta-propeller repeat protein [Pyxidicoccus xibeiensis]|uniref:hypothetical protein n=1 Tax=Pyxidicoccus xibeiensis TaxID=2906759 RepID=UPI0020A7E227|nr:hypothetical protein [Pyxidicoccus xibeiensis]MCP3142955.1 hypothetical protein [Pyxidicoccus xibeiensis]
MKSLVKWSALAVAVVVACTVPELGDEPRECADGVEPPCLDGYVCVNDYCVKADAGTSDAGTPPLWLELLPAPASPKGGAEFRYTDPVEPEARHLDRPATVRIRSDLEGLDAGTLTVRVRGTDGRDEPYAQFHPCDAGLFCREVEVPLWSRPLAAFRGTFVVTASILDATGDAGTASLDIPVTRWKWSFDGDAGVIQTSPAIGAGGTVYFGTSGTANNIGKVFSLSPEGTVRWSRAVGQVTTGPAVGAFANGGERVYVGVDAIRVHGAYTKVLMALPGDGGTPSYGCPRDVGDSYATPLALTTTQMSTDTTALETVVTQVELPNASGKNAASLVSFRPDDPGANRCLSLPSTADSPPVFGGMVVHGTNVYATGEPGILGFRFASNAWQSISATRSSRDWEMSGLALSGNGAQVVSVGASFDAGQSALVSSLATDGATSTEFLPARSGPPIRDLVLGGTAGSEIVYFGHDVAGGALTAVRLADMTKLTDAPDASVIPNAPVLGASGMLYTASGPQARGAEVVAWKASSLERLWKSDSVAPVAGWQSSREVYSSPSPALDCARTDGGVARAEQLGTLYVPGNNGVLYAVIVDSRGLDTDAPWPRFQHDARNTGNTATPLTCP